MPESISNSYSKIGIIGLAVMGSNLARNFASRGIQTSVYNRSYARTQELLSLHESNIVGFENLEGFVASLEKPRRVFLMVKSGDPVDEFIELLKPHLEIGDIIIDGGNSNWHDTQRRESDLNSLSFVGCGVSGGEEGALHGPSLMPGGDEKALKAIMPLLEQIAAKDFNGNPCVTPVGHGPAGHFVKMVHNGIEYAIMQGIAEMYDVARHLGLKNTEIASLFESLNRDELQSFLLDITVEVLRAKDTMNTGDLIDMVKSNAGAKGTGQWTVEAAMDLGVAIPNIANALFARTLSAKTQHFATEADPTSLQAISKQESEQMYQNLDINLWKKALAAIYYTSYVQGFDLILAANTMYKWNINVKEVVRIWQGGCIIRSQMLVQFSEQLSDNNELYYVSQHITESHESIRTFLEFVSHQSTINSMLNVHHAVLDYTLALGRMDLPLNLTQAQRDYFGAHTYLRVDIEGVFTGGWIPMHQITKLS